MADNPNSLPPGYKPWPPHNLVKEIEDKWAEHPGRKGQHWCVQVTGSNPLSGYIVVLQSMG